MLEGQTSHSLILQIYVLCGDTKGYDLFFCFQLTLEKDEGQGKVCFRL